MDIIRKAADPECSDALVNSVAIVDKVLAIPALKKHFKSLFGLGDLEDDVDFVSVLEVWIRVILLTIVSPIFLASQELGTRIKHQV